MLWTALVPLAVAGPAGDCPEEPLTVRFVVPEDGDTDAPRNARLLLGLIGVGDVETFDLVLEGEEGEVAGTRTRWCYDHEGPHEQHCWVALRPDRALAADTVHRVSVTSGDSIERTTTFETGSGVLEPLTVAPGLEILAAWDPKPAEVGPCDWETPRRYTLALTPAVPDPSLRSVYQVHVVDPTGVREPALIHTIRLYDSEDAFEAKQYLDRADEPSDCFRLQQEDGGGQLSPSVEACWWEEDDTGGEDSGRREGVEDSGVSPTDTDEPAGDDDARPPPPAEEGACGCGPRGGLVGWVGLLAVGWRLRGAPADPKGAAGGSRWSGSTRRRRQR